MTTALISPLIESLKDYPFERLRQLLAPIDPKPVNFTLGDMVDVSIGEPRHTPPELINIAIQKASHLWGKYPPVEGTDEFQESIKTYLDQHFGFDENIIKRKNMILPVSGTREGLFLAAQLAAGVKKQKGETYALMPNPFYTVYEAASKLAGIQPYFLPTTKENDFLPNLDAIPVEILEKTVIFYICTPSNPQGKAADLPYLMKLLKLAREYRFILVSDECYNELYNEISPVSALQAAIELNQTDDYSDCFANLLVFHSLSKRSSAPGLRSGFVCGDPNLITPFAKLRRYGHAGMPLPLMKASSALWLDDEHVQENRRLYQEKFDLAEQILGEKIDYKRPDGGFFIWLEVPDAETITKQLWQNHKIKVLPGNYITRPDANGYNIGDSYIRIALVHDLKITEYVCENLKNLL